MVRDRREGKGFNSKGKDRKSTLWVGCPTTRRQGRKGAEALHHGQRGREGLDQPSFATARRREESEGAEKLLRMKALEGRGSREGVSQRWAQKQRVWAR